ncbi:MAG: rRNA pseudouridine synthase [Ruminococcaceae bacterium]|nr:rRNA pseudouridine synthase [Oscillospiraceae bacterium]
MEIDMLRIDKYIADTGIASRKEIKDAARRGLVAVDGKTVRDVGMRIDESSARVTYCGQAVNWQKYEYLMLNKPSGYISSTEDSSKTVMKLLPEKYTKMELFPCGRLDIDTVGLLIITNDGPLAHRLLSPKHHAEKTYFYRCSPPIGEAEAQRLEGGVDIGDYITKTATVELITPESGNITLTEGKFHQIKRMFEAVGSNITYLRRIKFANLSLDESLAEGEWRKLTPKETEILRKTGEL